MQTPSQPRIMPQLAIAAVALTIIVSGMWSLYMADAPYHPEVTQAQVDLLTVTR